MAVRDEYNELATNYNQLKIERDKLLTRDESLTEKQGVIRYLQGQVVGLIAENDTLCRLQKQAIDNPPVVNPPIVVSPSNNETSGTIKHEPSLGPWTSLVNTSTKHCFKLQDPSVFTDGKKSLPVKY